MTEYSMICVKTDEEYGSAMEAATIDGWEPLGGPSVTAGDWLEIRQALKRETQGTAVRDADEEAAKKEIGRFVESMGWRSLLTMLTVARQGGVRSKP